MVPLLQIAELEIHPEVRAAVVENRPVVAFESTIITHGMPFPDNFEMARDVENIARTNGATPATIAVLDGRLRVGLSDGDLERLARAAQTAEKAARRDLPAAMARRVTAGTTVSATMAIAAKAGIRVFATGGIGGVHRGAETSYDISSDLSEFTRSPVAVVCAGAKAILDIPKTLEFLETLGVPVFGYGTDSFPAFYCRESEHAVDARFDSTERLAEAIALLWSHQLGAGVVVANPVPEDAAMERAEVETMIDAALAAAHRENIGGKAVTPFLLKTLLELSGGRSLTTNLALVRNNSRLAAELASALCRRKGQHQQSVAQHV